MFVEPPVLHSEAAGLCEILLSSGRGGRASREKWENDKIPLLWETDFYTPPVLGSAALLPFSAPAVYQNPVP